LLDDLLTDGVSDAEIAVVAVKDAKCKRLVGRIGMHGERGKRETNWRHVPAVTWYSRADKTKK